MAVDYLCLRRAAAQTYSSAGTWLAISWDAEDEDLAGFWAVGTPTKIIVPTGKAGKMIACCTTTWAAVSTGRNILAFWHYNSADVAQGLYQTSIGYGENHGSQTYELTMADADYLVVQIWGQLTGTFTSRLELARLGA